MWPAVVCPLDRRVGVMPLQGWAAAPTGMPNGHDFESVLPDPVVDPVANSFDVKAPYSWRAGLFNGGADFRLHEQQIESDSKILADGTWSGRPVCRPPLDYAFNLARGAARYVELERHRYS